MKLKIYLLVTVIFAMVVSCKKDFLDVPNKNLVLRQAYVVDLKTTGDYLNGIYIELARLLGSTGLNYGEVISDNIKPITGAVPFSNFYGWNQLADDTKPSAIAATALNANGIWIGGSKVARECSFVIENADKYREQDPAKAGNLKGQAHTLRALIYSMQVNIFAQAYSFTPNASHAGVPYIKVSDWTQPVTRLSVAEVYNELIADLQSAISLLPAVQTTPVDFKYSRISRTAAKALLARVYLQKGDWLAAKNMATEIATAVPIMTTNYPSKLFTNDETEAIFQMPPSSTNAGAGNYVTGFSAIYYIGNTYFLVATNGIASLIRENPADVRTAWLKDTTNGNIAIKKFPAGVIAGFNNPAGAYFQTLIRSSEMYLTAAEAYAQLQNRDSAIYYLDAIRKRAWPAAPSTTATGPALLDSIYKERRKELAFEGWRMYDIQRWKQAVNRSAADAPANMRTLPYGSDKAISPIPVSDVLFSGMTQNSGY